MDQREAGVHKKKSKNIIKMLNYWYYILAEAFLSIYYYHVQ